jgi:hypothetical protein
MVRADRGFGAALFVIALAPLAPAMIWALRVGPGELQGPLVLLCACAIWPACILPLVPVLVDRRGRGLVFRAIRGGPQPAIEIGPREGPGGKLVVPLGKAGTRGQVYRVGVGRRIVVAEALASTRAGEVLFARGGTRLDRELVQWLESLYASDAGPAPSADAGDVDAIAASAARAPLDPPARIEAGTAGGFDTWRYRSVEPRGRALGLSLIAVLALCTIAMPSLGIGTLTGWAAWTVPVGLALAYRLLLLTGPLTSEFQVRGTTLIHRRKRFGLTLWMTSSDARRTGLYVAELPFVALRCGDRLRGYANPAAGGPDAAAMAWLSAAIRARAGA